VSSDDLLSLLKQELMQLAKKNNLPSYEVPRDIVIETEHFTPTNGLLTPTMKHNRNMLVAKYSERLEQLYITLEQEDKKVHFQVLQTIGDVLGTKEQVNTNSFTEMGGDSVSAIRLVNVLKQRYGVDISKEVLFGEDFLDHVVKSIRGDATPIETQIDINQEIQLDSSIVGSKNIPTTRNVVFVTGCTGFIGTFLVKELLLTSYRSIYCLLRKSERANRYAEEFSNQISNQRIVLIYGDLSKPFFGLTTTEFENLGSKIDTIYHIGAIVNSVMPYSSLKAANVGGAIEVLRLATINIARTIPVYHISTTSIFGDTKGDIDENFDLRSIEEQMSSNPSDGYGLSKYIAERIVEIARTRNIPVTIFRLGMISSCSTTGRYNAEDWIMRLLYTIIRLRSAPLTSNTLQEYTEDGLNSGYLEMLPVDFTARAIRMLSEHNIGDSNTYHLVNDRVGILWADFVRTIINFYAQKGIEIEAIKSYSRWYRNAENECQKYQNDQEMNKRSILPILGSYARGIPVYPTPSHRLASSATYQALQQTPPAITSSMIRVLCMCMRMNKYI
jgi:thioester reductase-like protein